MNTKLFLLIGTSLSLISNVSYGSHINKESAVIARRTSSDEAIHNNINGSPRRINSPRDDDSDDFLSTHPNPLYQEREYREQATASLPLIGKDRMSRSFPISAQDARSAFHAQINPQRTDGIDLPQVASVCFITDAGHCWENEFYTGANTPDGSSGGTPGGSSGGDGGEDNWEVDNEEKCKKEGYINEDCGETATPGTPCLYDSSYHAGCVCKPEYNQTCSGADEAGKGASCDGKYKECCSLCSAYPYTDGTIPTGHVITETCQSCTGAKYKTKCNTNSSNTGAYISCGSATGNGAVCTDDSGTYYTQCTCPTNYEFNAQTQSCVCKTNFKYTCTGTGYAGGTGTSCGNKYQTCNCASGYTWSASSGCVKCGSSFKYTCTGANQTKPSSGCGGLYDKCNCKSGYKWSGGSCIAECSSSYKYSCTGTGYAGGAGSACGGKYIQCTCASGYEWSSSWCKKIPDGAHDNLYYCDGKVVGVRAPGMDFFVGMEELGTMTSANGSNLCRSIYFCEEHRAALPSSGQLLTIYQNKTNSSATGVNDLLEKYGGELLANAKYVSSSTRGTYPDYYPIFIDMSNGRDSYGWGKARVRAILENY